MKTLLNVTLALSLAAAPACTERATPADAGRPERERAAAAPTNRVDIPASVRQNLGVTFARVETRNVERTLRVPGRFELLPTAQREYRSPAPGTVELVVRQYEKVEAGAPLYRLNSPRWRELQRELNDADEAVQLALAGVESIGPFMEAHEKHHAEVQNAVDIWAERVAALERLRAAGGADAEDIARARAALATARAEFAQTLEKEAELLTRRREAEARLGAARSRAAILLGTASSLTGLPAEALSVSEGGRPRWRAIDAIEVRALSPGIVDSLAAISGSLVEGGGAVLTTVQPEQVRFRARALQSDLGKLSDGLPAVVVPPRSEAAATSVAAVLMLSPTADADRRTIELVAAPREPSALAPWARAGVSAYLEVVVSGGAERELAIPLRCVARDGTRAIIFRRDPADPDAAIRMEADLGIDDGRWVVIKSGVAEGNEVVLDGVYQLMVATSGAVAKGGHFHPDGTFHGGDE